MTAGVGQLIQNTDYNSIRTTVNGVFTNLSAGTLQATSATIGNALFVGGTFSANMNFAYLRDEKASGTNAGGFTSGNWRTRVLNTTSGKSFDFEDKATFKKPTG